MTTNTANTTKNENRGRPAKLLLNEEFVEMYNNCSNAKIAKEYGVTVSAVQKAARKLDMKKSETGRPCSMPDIAELKLLCANHTDKEIAQLHDVCPGTVAYWRKKAGITKYDKADKVI